MDPVDRMMSMELGNLNNNIIKQRLPLKFLLRQEAPQVRSRAGFHEFDRTQLERVWISYPLGLDLVSRWPTIFELVYL